MKSFKVEPGELKDTTGFCIDAIYNTKKIKQYFTIQFDEEYKKWVLFVLNAPEMEEDDPLGDRVHRESDPV